MINIFLNYLSNSSAITIIVLLVLSIYFISIIWLFIYRYTNLNSLVQNEKRSLESLVMNTHMTINPLSKLSRCTRNNIASKEILHACEISIIREASVGTSWLSIVASTSPFIGLFGTVIGILEAFAVFAGVEKVSFGTIAPAISEALIVTAGGIFVAIFAYTFHQILTRKVYDLHTYLKAQSEILISRT
jgi:biopolymer transport protein ExbB/TolQ